MPWYWILTGVVLYGIGLLALVGIGKVIDRIDGHE